MMRVAEMFRNFLMALICAFAASGQGLPDPVFDRVPFEDWLKETADGHIRWSTEVFPSRLGVHQRLRVGLSVRVDGAEFVKRAGPGQLVVFVEIRDHQGRVFRTHRALHFNEVKNPGDLATVSFDQYAMILPGDYQVATAVLDTASKEHVLKRTKLHVPDLQHDPLPQAWRNLPEVEYVTFVDPPDSWYLPDITSRLYLPVQNEKPVRVEVLVNESPSELSTRRVAGSVRRNMANIIPALKILSQMELRNGEINVTLLDLERRKVSFHQEEVKQLDWTGLRAALLENDPNQIDVHALENHEQNAQFFVSEIRKRLENTELNGDVPLGLTADAKRVLIVLSGPMAFPKGQDLRPIEAAPEPGTRVFYIRCYPTPAGFAGAGPGMGGFQPRGRMGPPPSASPMRIAVTEDSLARTLKPLAPRVFDVTQPMEFRNALAAIMTEISQIK